MIKETRIIDFLEILSSPQPTPGGGSVSALAASLAASLICKVSALTIGKKKYENVQDEVKEIYARSSNFKEKLLELADRDSEAFNKIINAYKTTKELVDLNEKQKIIEEASKDACLVPIETADVSYQILELSKRILEIGNKNALTDSLTAAYLAYSAINGALENVFFNLKNISIDQKFKIDTREKAEKIKTNSEALYNEIKKIAAEVK